jgi:hypothetical protein
VLSTVVTSADGGLPGCVERGNIGGPSFPKRLPLQRGCRRRPPGAYRARLLTYSPASKASSHTCFAAPTFRTFTVLVAGFLAQPGLRTVTGMQTGARLAAH